MQHWLNFALWRAIDISGLVLLAAFAQSAPQPQPPERHSVIIHIKGPLKQLPGEVLVEGMVPPAFTFRVERGTPTKGIVSCQQYQIQREVKDVKYPVVMLDCVDGSVLSLTGVDLAGMRTK